MRTIIGRGNDFEAAKQHLLAQLKEKLPAYLYPENLSNLHRAFLISKLKSHTHSLYNELTHYSLFLRDQKKSLNSEPSHGTKEWQLELKDGHIAAHLVQNDRLAILDNEAYLESARRFEILTHV